MLSGKLKTKFDTMLFSVAKYFTRINPNTITLVGIVVGVITSYLITLNFFVGGIFVLLTGFLDVLDGTVARISHKITKRGAYIDAVSDRITEFLIWFGIGIATNLWKYIIIAIFLSQLISYSKARCGMETKINNVAWPDFFERGERILYTAFMLLLWNFYPIFREVILLFILFEIVTFLQRIKRALIIL